MSARLLAIALFILPCAHAADVVDYRCPAQVVTSQKLTQPIPSWRESIDGQGPSALDGVMLFEGPPEKLGSLVPDNDDGGRGDLWTNEWDVKDYKEDDIWLACLYRGTNIVLSQKIAHGVQKCFVTTNRKLANHVERAWCTR